MLKSPEKYTHKGPRLALASLAFLSLGVRTEVNVAHETTGAYESALKSEPMSISYPVRPANQILGNYLWGLQQREKLYILVHQTPAQQAAAAVTPHIYSEYAKVDQCEEQGDWDLQGSKFSGGLGISNYNWVHYGGLYFAPNGGLATPDEQILIARRIQPIAPDQHGCHRW